MQRLEPALHLVSRGWFLLHEGMCRVRKPQQGIGHRPGIQDVAARLDSHTLPVGASQEAPQLSANEGLSHLAHYVRQDQAKGTLVVASGRRGGIEHYRCKIHIHQAQEVARVMRANSGKACAGSSRCCILRSARIRSNVASAKGNR